MKINKIYIGVFACLVIFVIFWIGQINKANDVDKTILEYDMGQEIEIDGFSVQATEAYLLTHEGFEQKFGYSLEEICPYIPDEGKIIAAKLTVKNISNAMISWDEIMGKIELGFESLTWASANDPFIGMYVNVFYDEGLLVNKTQDVWMLTSVNKGCFKDKTWKNIAEESFYYVLSLEPKKTRIKLELSKEIIK